MIEKIQGNIYFSLMKLDPNNQFMRYLFWLILMRIEKKLWIFY